MNWKNIRENLRFTLTGVNSIKRPSITSFVVILLLFGLGPLAACDLSSPRICYSTTSFGRGALSFTVSQLYGRDRDLVHVKQLGPNGELNLIHKIYSYRIYKTRQLVADVSMFYFPNDWVVRRVVKVRVSRNIRRLILDGIRKFEKNQVKPYQAQNYQIENRGWFWM